MKMLEKWKYDLLPKNISTTCASFAREYTPELIDSKKYAKACEEVIRDSLLEQVFEELDEREKANIDELFKIISIKKSELTSTEDDIRKKINKTKDLDALGKLVVRIDNLDRDPETKHPNVESHIRLLLILDDIQTELVKKGSV